MRKLAISLLILLSSLGQIAKANPFKLHVIGRTSVFNNDYFGDGEDRWRTGSYSRSTYFGEPWSGEIPSDRSIYEFRFRGEVIAPTDASLPPAVGERPYVGVAAVGAFRHFKRGSTDFRLGAEIVAIGPQTGVSSLVTQAHDLLGFKTVRASTGELGNDVIPTVSGEAYKTIERTAKRRFEIRPFAELQVGVENYARVGADVFFGNSVSGDFMTRDVVTGQLLTAANIHRMPGFTPSLGVDVAHVWGSSYLPASSGISHKTWRARVRAGFRSQSENRDVFFGLTWLSPEYEGQPNGQVLGSLSVNSRF